MRRYVDVDTLAKNEILRIPKGVEVSLDRWLWECKVKESRLLYWLERAEKVGEVEIDTKKNTLKRL